MSIFTPCNKNGSAAAEHVLTAKTIMNVPYGSDTAQKMDVYLPAGRSADKTKSIVLIHGGSWNAGNKTDLAAYIDTFKKRLPDYAIFNLNYRLVNASNRFPTQEQDIHDALKLIADSADDFTIDKNRIALLGVSAGAHLALLHAYKYTNPVKVNAVIDFFGPTDLLSMYNQPWHPLIPYLMEMVTGTTPTNNEDAYKQSSPLYFVNAQSAPTLILQGGRDNIVAPSQSRILKHKLDAAGVKNELVLYEKEGHGWYGNNLVNSFNKIEEFLEQHMK